MAFSSTIEGQTVSGRAKLVWGTFNAASVTTGDIDTGKQDVYFMFLQTKSDAVVATGASVDETIPFRDGGNAVTIDTANGETGYWFGICRL